MIKKYRWLITVLIIYYAVFYGCGALLAAGGNGAYMLSAAGALFSFGLYTLLWNKAPSYKSKSVSSAIRKVIDILLLISLIVQATAVCTLSVSSVSATFMKHSPFPYLLIFFIIPALFAGYSGIKAVARYAFIGGIGIIFMIFLILLFASGDYSAKNIFPLTGRIFSEPIANIITAVSLYSNLMYLYIIGDSPGQKPSVAESAKVVLISGSVFTSICLICSLTVPYEAIAHISDPLLYVASTVDFSFLVERSEGLVLMIRLFTSFICICALICLLCKISKDAFALKDSKALIWIYALIISSGALITDKTHTVDFLIRFSAIWTLGVSATIPLILRLAGKVKKDII